jgi:hypothetical protein
VAARGPPKPEGPKPTEKVKNFNWAKIPNNKVAGTIFESMDGDIKDFKVFSLLNYFPSLIH